MRIEIDYQNTRQSWTKEIKEGTIGPSQVEALPWGLRRKMVTLLNALKARSIKQVLIDTKDIARSLLEIEHKIAIQGFLDQAKEKQFIRDIGLLVWYLSPHWYTPDDPPNMTGVFCIDCETMSRSIKEPDHCEFPDCPSHKKWRMALGPSYVPPPQE